jgi:hypothetical protein
LIHSCHGNSHFWRNVSFPDTLPPSSGNNTFGAIRRMERYKATLALENIAEYERQFPPSAEQLAARERARRIIENPPTQESVWHTLSSDEQKELVDSLNAILNPEIKEAE